MGKNYFTDEQVELLKKNKYVKHVSNKSITYTLEFKNLFISEYGIKSATIIFEEAGLPKSIYAGIWSYLSKVLTHLKICGAVSAVCGIALWAIGFTLGKKKTA